MLMTCWVPNHGLEEQSYKMESSRFIYVHSIVPAMQEIVCECAVGIMQ